MIEDTTIVYSGIMSLDTPGLPSDKEMTEQEARELVDKSCLEQYLELLKNRDS